MDSLALTLEKTGFDALNEALQKLYAEKDGKYTLKLAGFDEYKTAAAKLAEATAKLEAEDKAKKELEAKLAELEKSKADDTKKLTEVEKLQQRLAEFEAKDKARMIRDAKTKALKEAKYPDEKIESLLLRVAGEDEAAIKADVAELVKIFPPVTKTGGDGNPPKGGLPSFEDTNKELLKQTEEAAAYKKRLLEDQEKRFKA